MSECEVSISGEDGASVKIVNGLWGSGAGIFFAAYSALKKAGGSPEEEVSGYTHIRVPGHVLRPLLESYDGAECYPSRSASVEDVHALAAGLKDEQLYSLHLEEW